MKKRILLALAAVGFAYTAQAQTAITIQQARAQAVGQTVTIGGIVTNGGELGRLRFIDDGTAGIALFYTSDSLVREPVVRGDSVFVTGVLKQFNNLLELDPITVSRVVSQNNRLHDTLVFNAGNWGAAYSEDNEGRLVRLNRIPRVTSGTGTAITSFNVTGSGANFRLNGDASLAMRVLSTSSGPSGIVGKPTPADTFDIVGIMSQFSAAVPTSGYQLQPRLYDDIVLGPAPNFSSRIFETNVTTTSLSLGFTTTNPGSTRVEFGSTPALGNIQDDPTQVTNHTFTLQNLTPGTVYWVRVSSSNVNGTTQGPMQVFATQSLSSGTIRAYFNHSVATQDALPGNEAIVSQAGLDDTLISYINRATESLDIAIYNWNNTGLSNITNAVNAAYTRGVRVRIITDGSAVNVGLNTLNPAIRTLRSPTTMAFGLMHNKFVIIDADAADPSKPWLWTGSLNWTDDMVVDAWNNVITFQDQALARSYKVEFEEMWGSTTLTPGSVFTGPGSAGTALFGPYKTDNTPHYIKLGTTGKEVNLYFSPSDGTQGQIIGAISSAESSFQIGTNLITRTEYAIAIRNKYQALGAASCSRVLVDDTSQSGSGLAYRIMLPTLGNNLQMFAPRGTFHHKYVIVDQEVTAGDPKVVTGSHNWSGSAEQRNDENTVIVHDQRTANQYYQEFQQRWADDGQTNCITVSIQPRLASAIQLAPNPAEEGVTISLPTLAGKQVKLLGADGRLLQSRVATGASLYLPTHTLAPGAYLIQVEGVAVPARFMKQ